MVLCTLLRATQNQIAYLYYARSEKDVNMEMYLRIVSLLVKIYTYVRI